MIVCSCNVLTDNDVHSVLDIGAEKLPTAGEIYACLSCTPKCGRCAHSIRQIIVERAASP